MKKHVRFFINCIECIGITLTFSAIFLPLIIYFLFNDILFCFVLILLLIYPLVVGIEKNIYYLSYYVSIDDEQIIFYHRNKVIKIYSKYEISYIIKCIDKRTKIFSICTYDGDAEIIGYTKKIENQLRKIKNITNQI